MKLGTIFKTKRGNCTDSELFSQRFIVFSFESPESLIILPWILLQSLNDLGEPDSLYPLTTPYAYIHVLLPGFRFLNTLTRSIPDIGTVFGLYCNSDYR